MIHFGMVRAQKHLTDRSVGRKRSVGGKPIGLRAHGGNATDDVPSKNIVSQTIASPQINTYNFLSTARHVLYGLLLTFQQFLEN